MLGKLFNTYFLIGLTILTILTIYCSNDIKYTWIYVFNIVNFLCFSIYLMCAYNYPERYFSKYRLFFYTFLYGLFTILWYYIIFDIYKGDSFLYSLYDGPKYELIMQQYFGKPIVEVCEYVMNKWDIGDLGGPLYLTIIYKIIPSFYFVSFIHVLLGAINAMALFYIGTQIMHSKSYAYLAAFCYSLSSCTLYFCGAHIKETGMCFFIIHSFYFFYKYLERESVVNLVLCLCFALCVIAFREPVAGFILLSFMTYVLYNQKQGRLPLLFLMILTAIALVFVHPMVESVFMKYTANGNLSKGENYQNATSFSILVSTLGSLFGPFPDFLPLKTDLNSKSIESAGVLMKFLLFPLFWYGFFTVFKNHKAKILPIFVFVVLEAIAIAVANDGLEVRKSFPHYSMFFIASFWSLDYIDNVDDNENNYNKVNRLVNISIVVVFVCSLAWNTLRIMV